MSFEGNYLDGLMSRKESIYNLLRAKYYLNCIIVFIPFLIMMIPVAKGKIPFLMALSYMLFTAGFVFAMMLQLAVYNKKTLPLTPMSCEAIGEVPYSRPLSSHVLFSCP